MKMVNDFLVEKSENELHLLNIVSPGFTCAMPVADYIVNQLSSILMEKT